MFKCLRKITHFPNITNLTNLTNFKTFNCIYPYAKFACPITNEERQKMKKRYSLFKAGKKPKKRNEKRIHIAHKTPIVREEELSNPIKQELDKQVSYLTSIGESEIKMERMTAVNYMQKMDSSFEGFFFKREFNLNNFNYYLQILSRQSKNEQFDSVIEKMESMGIKPNLESYTHILTGYARAKDIQKCEEIFDLVKHQKKWAPNKFIYNSLLLAYAKNLKVQETDAILREMKEEGIIPDVVCYTTVLVAYKRAGLYNKCWDIYQQALSSGSADEMIMSYMIRICAATHESEKALTIYQTMDLKGFTKTALNFNSIIWALSAKKKYAEKAIEMFLKMKEMGIKPDMHTYVGVLRATSHLGDINMANDIVKEIKLLGYTINEHVCNGLIRTYAGASRIKYVRNEHLEAYIKDAWEIYHFMEKENIPINIQILNALLEVHTTNHKLEMVDGLVMPLFDKHNVQMNKFTYQHIFGMLIDLRKFNEIISLFDKMQRNGIEASQKILNIFLEAGIRTDNSDHIVFALEELRRIERSADPWLLRILTNMKDLPDRIYAELKANHLHYNLMKKDRWKTFTPASYKNLSRTKPGLPFRRDGKRTKLR